jgi:predicted house-cleaning noncanonical NTP pyrophosphatase (MazG superfamily)
MHSLCHCKSPEEFGKYLKVVLLEELSRWIEDYGQKLNESVKEYVIDKVITVH